MIHSRYSLAFAAILWLCLAGNSQNVSWQHKTVDADPPENPWIKLIADLNQDNQPDIIVGGSRGPLVWYRYPDWETYVITEGGYDTVDGEAGDMDNDGDLDIVLGGIVWYENPSSEQGILTESWIAHRVADHKTHDVELSDLDLDGDIDIVTRDQSDFGAKTGNEIWVWFQEKGEWSGLKLDCPHGEGVEAADLDLDGDLDIAIGGIWFENRLSGDSIAWTPHEFGRFHRSASVQVGDINLDGRPDIVLSPSELRGERYRISWFEAPEDPKQSEWTEHVIEEDVETVYHSLEVADFNNDGQLDFVTAEMHQGEDPDDVLVYINKNKGQAWSKQMVSETGSHLIRTGDIGNDGDVDFIGANHGGARHPLELWINLSD